MAGVEEQGQAETQAVAGLGCTGGLHPPYSR